MRHAPSIVVLLLGGLLPGFASADRGWVPGSMDGGNLAVEIHDRTDHRALPVHAHAGRLYVAGEPGHQYEIRLRNRSNQRLLAVTSVDGVNVISGETARSAQSGYVLAPRDSVAIDGWRKSLDEVATFYFTRLSDSYAARTGRPENVGVIGVAVFRERRRCCRNRPLDGPLEERSTEAAEEPLARGEAAEDVNASPRRARDKLGTGHGHRETSPVELVDFERASSTPEQTIVIYYDSRKNLVARGVIPEPGKYARHPDPFPNEFVPDP